jgi:hypothetical protein
VPSFCVGILSGGAAYFSQSRLVVENRKKACREMGGEGFEPSYPGYAPLVRLMIVFKTDMRTTN